MSVRPASDPDALAAWRAAWPGDDPFGDVEYIAALSEAGVDLVVAEAGPSSGAVLATRRIGPFRQATLPPFTPYTALALDPADDEASTHRGESSIQAVGELVAAAFDDVLLHLPPQVRDVRPLQWAGWTVEPRYTYRIDPRTGGDPSAWSSGPRRTFRHHRDAYQIEEATVAAPEVAALCASSYRRHGRRPPLPADQMARVARRVVDAGTGRALLARDERGLPAAGIVLLSSGPVSYYWMAGSVPGPAMTVLLGTVLRLLADEQGTVLDLVGANTPSIAEFKRRFNPELVRYHSSRRTSSGLVRVARSLRRLIRN